MNGPESGALFKLLGNEVHIGRSDDNHIVLKDPKCSRQHAVLLFNGTQWMIRNVSSKSYVVVNGQAVQESVINVGSVFQVGETQMSIQLESHNSVMPTTGASFGGAALDVKLGGATPKNKTFFYALVGVIALLVLVLISNKEKNAKKADSIRSAESIEAEIEASKERAEVLAEAQVKAGKNTQQYEEAQSSYLKGFRDYREGNYPRAIQSFQAALALYPNHTLAQRYLDNSQKKLDELVQYYMYLGKHYMEQNKYEAAKAAYKNVMILKASPDDLIFKEAQTRFNECETLIKGAR